MTCNDFGYTALLTAHNVWVTVRTDVTEQGKPAMSPRTDAAAWKRLGELLIRRRIELDPAYQNRTTFCTERGIDYRLAYDIEEARRTNFRKGTLAGIAAAYGVTLDSLYAALTGGELAAAPASRAAQTRPLYAITDSGEQSGNRADADPAGRALADLVARYPDDDILRRIATRGGADAETRLREATGWLDAHLGHEGNGTAS